MKYKQSKKQNQRITRISDKTLVVGADIAKETHVARAIDFRGIELGKGLCVLKYLYRTRATGSVDEGASAGACQERRPLWH